MSSLKHRFANQSEWPQRAIIVRPSTREQAHVEAILAPLSINKLTEAMEIMAWHRKPERLGGREINDQIEFHWLLDRNLSGLCPAQDLIDEISGTSPHTRPVRSIGHQTTRFDVLSHAVQRRKPCAQRQSIDTRPVGE